MTDPDLAGHQVPVPQSSPKISAKRRAAKAKKDIQARCMAANLKCEEVVGLDSKPLLKVGLNSGRELRWVYLENRDRIVEFASVDFEKWGFLSGYDAICSYPHGLIEALVLFTAPSGTTSMAQFRRMFAPVGSVPRVSWDLSSVRLVLEPPQEGFPTIEISLASDVFKKLAGSWMGALTIKLSSCKVKTDDQSLSLLGKLSRSMFFQIDLLSDVALALAREPRRSLTRGAQGTAKNFSGDLQYPRNELDDAPSSLYRYGRSASGMPLLQFLAFYQVIEFYYPVYSKAEAQRRVKSVLKDPTFRGDRDADIGRLLSAIYISRSGTYGDERSQLRATLMECVDSGDLRTFLELDSGRRDFYLAKGKSSYHKLPLGNPVADLRNDVSDRIYDIRCKIVHTKADSRKEDAELLLPFSKEAEGLFFDIQLVRYIAQRVLITASAPLKIAG